MAGEKKLDELLKTMRPVLNPGEYVFCTINDIKDIDMNDIVLVFNEREATTIIVKKEIADKLKFGYSFVASWITLSVHSSLEAVGFTAAFSKALAEANISCNAVAAFFHDHIFVDKKDGQAAMTILKKLSERF